MLSTPIPPITKRGRREHEHQALRLVERELVQQLQAAPDADRLDVVRGDAETPGQDRAHLALRLLHQMPVAQPVDDLAHHEFVGPPTRPVRLQGADRDPGVLVDLETVARELRADVREQPHHLEGLARDPHPAPEAPFDAEQAAAHLVAQHDDAAVVLDVLARDASPGGERHAAHRHRLRVEPAHVDVDRARAEGRREHLPGLRADQLRQLRAAAQELDVVDRPPQVAAVHGGRELLAHAAGPHLAHVLAGLEEAALEHRGHALAPADQEDHGGGAPDQPEEREQRAKAVRPEQAHRLAHGFEQQHR